MKRLNFTTALTAAALALLSASPRAGAATIAITGGTIHDMRGTPPYVGTIVIDGERITAAGPDVAVPAGATTIDAAGLSVYPGLIDAGSVLGLTEIGSVSGTVDTREIGNINPNVRAESSINPDSELLPVARVNGITSAAVTPRGGTLAGTSALVHLDGWTWEQMTVKSPLMLCVNWPGRPAYSPWGGEARPDDERARKAREQQLADLKKAFDDARSYLTARRAEGRPGVPHHDVEPKWEAVVPVLEGRMPVCVVARWAEDIEAAIDWADHEGIGIVLAGVKDIRPVMDKVKARNIPVILDPAFDFPTRRYLPYDQGYGLAADLDKAGIRFAFSMGNEASNTRNLPYSAAMAVAYGLNEETALQSMTSRSADILGVADRVGSIAPGLYADLLITNGSPLDIRTQVRHVLIAGRDIPLTSRHTALYEKYRNRPRPETPPKG